MRYFSISTILAVLTLQLACNSIRASRDQDKTTTLNVHSSGELEINQSARSKFRFFSIYDFKEFKKVFNKQYTSIVENLSRKRFYILRALRAFKSSVRYKYNKSDHYLKINQMSDWTHNELEDVTIPPAEVLSEHHHDMFKEGSKSIERKRYKRGILKDSKIALNKVIRGSGYDFVTTDHRNSDCLNPVKDQGHCGSCYIYATVALYEWLHCKATGNLVEFSEQYAIDCGHSSGANGCQGGVFKNVVDFIKDYGLETYENYPNTQSQGFCPYESSMSPNSMGFIRPVIGGFHWVDEEDFEKHLKKEPIAVALLLNEYFFEYGGGVDDAKGCDLSRFHLVLLIGSGREEGKDYWLFRNSHGSTWGNDGHYKLNKNSNCIMMSLGYVSKDKFKTNSRENINPNYESRAR